MTSFQQPSAAPVTQKANSPNVSGKVPMKLPLTSLVLGISSCVLLLVPFLGLGLGIAAIIVGFKAINSSRATATAWAGTVLGIGGAMIGIAIIIAAFAFGLTIFRSAS